jgi:hypothetical protein
MEISVTATVNWATIKKALKDAVSENGKYGCGPQLTEQDAVMLEKLAAKIRERIEWHNDAVHNWG